MSIIGERSDGRRETVIMELIKKVTHTSSGLVIVSYRNGKTRMYRNFIIV
jgi:hypothetical protein